MPDRFVHYEKPPIEVGCCATCSGTMYDYEQTICPACDSKVHKDCLRECWICGMKGCGACIAHEDLNLEYVCEICMSNRKYITDVVRTEFGVPNYWHSGTEEDEDNVILEFTSGDYPKIKVLIEKKEKT